MRCARRSAARRTPLSPPAASASRAASLRGWGGWVRGRGEVRGWAGARGWWRWEPVWGGLGRAGAGWGGGGVGGALAGLGAGPLRGLPEERADAFLACVRGGAGGGRGGEGAAGGAGSIGGRRARGGGLSLGRSVRHRQVATGVPSVRAGSGGGPRGTAPHRTVVLPLGPGGVGGAGSRERRGARISCGVEMRTLSPGGPPRRHPP